MRTEMTSRSHPGRTQLPLHVLQVPRPSHHLLLIASNFYVLEMVRNWTMGEHGNNTTANHVSHFFIRPTDSSNRLSLLHPTHRFIKSSLTSSSDPQIHQIVILQLHRHKTCSATISIYIYRIPELHWSRLQILKCFMYRIAYWFLNQHLHWELPSKFNRNQVGSQLKRYV